MSVAITNRLTRRDWLNAGLAGLAEHGPDALKAEPLARRLGTTKGSFYWHFEDVPAFHTAVLHEWESAALAKVQSALNEEIAPVSRLRLLGQVIASASTDGTVEPAIRAWAKGNAAAATALQRVDAQRQVTLRDLLEDTGIGNPEMTRIIYAASIGMAEIAESSTGENDRTMGSLVDLVLALR